MLEFFLSTNLTAKELISGYPWEFLPGEKRMGFAKGLKKEVRRQWLLKPDTDWQVYTPVRALASNQRVSKANPPVGLRAIVVDYDAKTSPEGVIDYINDLKTPKPNMLEVSLSGKCRLVWFFEREILVPTIEHCQNLIERFFDKLGARTLLPGFDAASAKPTEVWTNGGAWYHLTPAPLSSEYCFGIAADVARKTNDFCRGEIPLEIIAKEVEAKFPGKWQGAFEAGQTGVRFWDQAADCPTGCQVKPDGCLCFTGPVPFVTWADIFGRAWVDEQRALNLGRAGESVYFDGKNYWEQAGDRWVTLARTDTILLLKNRGLSDKVPKGATCSDVDRVLRHVQSQNRVAGAAPLVNYRPGLVDLNGRRILNITTLKLLDLPPSATIDDFRFIWDFVHTLFVEPEAAYYWLAWTQRTVRAAYTYTPTIGQSMFICGPAGNGKTLLARRVLLPMLGGRYASPVDYFMGRTPFSDHLFEVLLLLSDDDAPATSEAERFKMAARLKSFSVNHEKTYHPKYCQQIEIPWMGRYVASLNDDPTSVGLLPEVNPATQDKLMFFGSKPRLEAWPESSELEARLAKQTPFFCRFLLDNFEAPTEVVSGDRMGVKSFFSARILEMAQQQDYSYNLRELLRSWMDMDAEFQETPFWIGTPTDLMTRMSICDPLAALIREWTVPKIAKSLTGLAKVPGHGVSFDEGRRTFKVVKEGLQ